jgi:hypothetical protein
VLDTHRRKYFRCYDSYRSASRQTLPALGPPKFDVPGALVQPKDKKLGDNSCVGSTDDKLWALKQYRRAHGLCHRCAEKWVPGHKCAQSVHLHVIQELLDLSPDEEEHSTKMTQVDEHSESPGQLFACLSEAVVTRAEAPKSMRLVGTIQGHEILLLVDSGNSHTFLSKVLATELLGVCALDCPL